MELPELEASVLLDRDETIHSESSYKFTSEDVEELAAQSGWKILERWQDPDALFELDLLIATGDAG